MIIIEPYKIRSDGVQLVRTYSDNGMMIEREGARYCDAVDPAGMDRTYTETDEPAYADEATAADYQAALAEMGVQV